MDSRGVLKLIILIVGFDLAFCNKYCDREFRNRGYIPQFADGLKCTDLEVLYNNRKVECGETVAQLKLLKPPTIKYNVKGRCPNVTIIEFSPDDVLNPPVPVWIAFNVPSSELAKGFNNGGDITDKLAGRNQVSDVVAPYILPEDPTSSVRTLTLIFLVYCQCHYISDKRELDRVHRLRFDVKSYMKEHGLKCPVAGLFHEFSLTGLPALQLPVDLAPVQAPLPNTPDLPLGHLTNPNLPV